MVKRTAYQNGYEDAQDRGRFASGLPKHTDIDDYNRGFREGEAALKANTPSPITYTRCPDHAAELARVQDDFLKMNNLAYEWRVRAERAEAYVAGQDVRSDFRTAGEMRAALDLALRENTLLRAECEAWRAWFAWKFGDGNKPSDVTSKLIEARAATDEAGILRDGAKGAER